MKIIKDGESPVFAKNSRVRFRRDVSVSAPKEGDSKMDHSCVEKGTLGTITDILPYVIVSIDTDSPGIRRQIAWHRSVNLSGDLELVESRPKLTVIK